MALTRSWPGCRTARGSSGRSGQSCESKEGSINTGVRSKESRCFRQNLRARTPPRNVWEQRGLTGYKRHHVVPLNRMPSEQWVERVSGDPEKAGMPFVIRIHNDAGYIVLPHVHPIDENITVVQGSWWLGMGERFTRSTLDPLELGTFGVVPKNMAHFAWSKTETIIQVHGIGPFGSTLVDPVVRDHGEGRLRADLVASARSSRVVEPTGLFRTQDRRPSARR